MAVDDDNYSDPGVPQLHKPTDNAIRQQRLNAWHPILDPVWVICTYLVIGLIFIPCGLKLRFDSDDLLEIVVYYDAYDNPERDKCGITKANEKGDCYIEFAITEDMKPPILVHYQLENFHQNHRLYERSRDDYQLAGEIEQSKIQKDLCAPLQQLGNQTLNPCGFIANTLFNDVITLDSVVDTNNTKLDDVIMVEEGIAWESDRKYKFKQPKEFDYEECDCSDCSCEGDQWSCDEPYYDPKDEKCYRYFYPNDDTTRYLHETYPMVVSPIEGVQNEHFIVWMRIAALPKFRKLYGYIEQPILAGTNITFHIQTNFEVKSFQGSKAIILSTTNAFGARNLWLGNSYIFIGAISAFFGIAFGFKHIINPRKIGDKKYLVYKED